jgi:hypothetical protein
MAIKRKFCLMIIHYKKGKTDVYRFKAKDFDMLLPAMYDVKFEEITSKNSKIAS